MAHRPDVIDLTDLPRRPRVDHHAPLTRTRAVDRRTLLTWCLRVGGAALTPVGWAATTPDFTTARNLFLKASGGDDQAIDPAAEQFAQLLSAHPTDPVLMAYAGAAESLRAKTTLLPWRKMRHADDGLAQIDKALALVSSGGEAPGPSEVPAVLEVRFVAANTFLALPSLFNRHARGEKLLAEVQSSPLLSTAAAGFREQVARRAAQLKALSQGPKDAQDPKGAGQ